MNIRQVLQYVGFGKWSSLVWTKRIQGAAWTVVVLSILIVMVLMMSGCDVFAPKTTSPISGQPVTAPQLVAELDRADAAKAREEAKAKAAAEAAIRKAKAEAEAQLANLEAAADIERAQRRAEAAQVVRDAQVKQAEVTANLAATVDRLAAEREALNASAETALADIERQREQALGFARVLQGIPGVAQATTAAGLGPSGIETIFGLALGGAGVGYMQKRARRRENEAWDEAERKAREQAQQNQMLLLALLDKNKNGKIDADEVKGVA